MDRARRAGLVSDTGFGRADVHGVGRRPDRQPGEPSDPRRRDGEVHSVFGAVSMKVKVLYFAGLREQLGRPGEELDVSPAVTTVAGVRTLLMARAGAWPTAPAQAQALPAPPTHQHAHPPTP